jgi:hypothetical protein
MGVDTFIHVSPSSYYQLNSPVCSFIPILNTGSLTEGGFVPFLNVPFLCSRCSYKRDAGPFASFLMLSCRPAPNT